jgi:hypothetical protein
VKQGLDDRLDDACPKAGIQSIANQLKLDLVNSQAQVVDLSMELASASQLDGEV